MRLNVLSHFKEPTPMFMTTFWHLQYMTFIGNCPTVQLGSAAGQDNDDNLYVYFTILIHTYICSAVLWAPE